MFSKAISRSERRHAQALHAPIAKTKRACHRSEAPENPWRIAPGKIVHGDFRQREIVGIFRNRAALAHASRRMSRHRDLNELAFAHTDCFPANTVYARRHCAR
jgi:hypothetical protein